MIRVRIDLRSSRGAKYDRRLADVAIANDGTGSKSRGNYAAAASRPGGKIREARVTNFPRKSRSALELLRRALNNLHEAGELP